MVAAGGNLAAAVSILARDRQGPKLALELLYYPCVGASVEHPSGKSEYASMAEFGPGSEGLLTSEDATRLMGMCALLVAPVHFISPKSCCSSFKSCPSAHGTACKGLRAG